MAKLPRVTLLILVIAASLLLFTPFARTYSADGVFFGCLFAGLFVMTGGSIWNILRAASPIVLMMHTGHRKSGNTMAPIARMEEVEGEGLPALRIQGIDGLDAHQVNSTDRSMLVAPEASFETLPGIKATLCYAHPLALEHTSKTKGFFGSLYERVARTHPKLNWNTDKETISEFWFSYLNGLVQRISQMDEAKQSSLISRATPIADAQDTVIRGREGQLALAARVANLGPPKGVFGRLREWLFGRPTTTSQDDKARSVDGQEERYR
jgi:hypothetical protein